MAGATQQLADDSLPLAMYECPLLGMKIILDRRRPGENRHAYRRRIAAEKRGRRVLEGRR
jgi:hypothetical protein